MNPPVPGVDASTNDSDDTHSELPVVSKTCSSETFLSASRFGSTCTCSCRSRCPQMETFATPGTPISRGWTVQRASTDMLMCDTDFDERLMIITRFEDESGCNMSGGLDT